MGNEEPSFHFVAAATRAEIDAISDSETLGELFERHNEQAEEIHHFLNARRIGMGEHVDKVWMRKASDRIAYLTRAAHWIEKRMLRLGFQPPYSPTDPRARELRALNERVVILKNALRKAGLPIPGEEQAE